MSDLPEDKMDVCPSLSRNDVHLHPKRRFDYNYNFKLKWSNLLQVKFLSFTLLTYLIIFSVCNFISSGQNEKLKLLHSADTFLSYL